MKTRKNVLCQRVLSKKYKTRKSPPYHANNCKGKVLKGNDGADWKSVSDKRGIFKWIKEIQMPVGKRYETHDNGGRPFIVIDTGGQIQVWNQKWDEEQQKRIPDKKVFETKYEKLFVGKNRKALPENPTYSVNPEFVGNSLLAQVSKHKYVFIGHEIKEFEIDEEIESYESPVGNSDVPYPYAVGPDFTYFILENKVVPNNALDFKKDLYGQLYGHIETEKQIKKEVSILKKKIIVPRYAAK